MGEGLSNELLNLGRLLGPSRLLNTGLALGERSTDPDEAQLETYRKLLDLVVASGHAPRAVMETGVGFGKGAAYIGDRLGVAPIGVDVSRVAAWAARSRGVATYRANLRDLTVPDGAFDLICAVECLVATDASLPSYEACARLLRSGGQLAIAEFRLGGIASARRHLSKVTADNALTVSVFEDFTEAARASVLDYADVRAHSLRFVPPPVRGWVSEIASLPGSKRHAQWLNGERCYFLAILEKAGDCL